MSPSRFLRSLAAKAALASLLAWGLPSCSSGTDTADPSVVLYVVVNATTNFVEVGQTLQLIATGYNGNNVVVGGVNFTWYTSDGSIAGVDQSGVVTGVAPGRTTITATGGGTQGQFVLPVVPRDGG
jgi:Bacterial Ig-like domain (group 2)